MPWISEPWVCRSPHSWLLWKTWPSYHVWGMVKRSSGSEDSNPRVSTHKSWWKKFQLFYLEGTYKKQITLRLFQMEALFKFVFHLSVTFTGQNCLELIKPLRVKAFCWAACLDKILVLYNLECQKVALLNICFMCWAMDEPINHLFLHCVSTQILVFLGSLFGVFFPLSPSFFFTPRSLRGPFFIRGPYVTGSFTFTNSMGNMNGKE